MIGVYGVDKTRALEEAAMRFAGPDALMQRAAYGLSVAVASELRSLRGGVYGARVVILVGAGNNGGDALFAGARLAARGVRVSVASAFGRPHPAGSAALAAAGGRTVDLAAVLREPADLVLDGMLGIGGRPGLPDHVASALVDLEGRGTPVLAVDLPSGVGADSGAVPAAAVRAVRTVTFGTPKPCHVLHPARGRCGRLDVVDIGLATDGAEPDLLAWETADVVAAWPFPTAADDKYARGVVGVDTGSDTYPGAAILSTSGAVYGGAGMVRFLGPAAAGEVIVELLPNVVRAPGRVQAHLVGSGWGDRPDRREALARLATEGLPMVVDADGLTVLPDDLGPQVLLTPHAGELARLLGVARAEVEADPVGSARRAAARTGATVLLKGASQVVASPEGGPVQVAVPGPAWTAQAGSGDVLAGLCATGLASGVPASTAAVLGASVQAMAAARNPGPLPPQELAREVARVLGELGPGLGS